MPKPIAVVAALLVLAGCAQGPGMMRPKSATDAAPGLPTQTVAVTEAIGTDSAPPATNAVTVEQFDTTTTAERKAAEVAPPEPSESRLGTTIASLGDPTDPGFWAETGLVKAVTEGRLEYPGSGKSVKVELRPSGGVPGSGTRVSLPALRVLEAPLTDLPQLVVYGS